jgi:hypothetical protein
LSIAAPREVAGEVAGEVEGEAESEADPLTELFPNIPIGSRTK